MESASLIYGLKIAEAPMYAKAEHDHAVGVALVMVYKKS